MCNNAPGRLHSKRRCVWRPARRRCDTPGRANTREIVPRCRPVIACKRIGAQFVRDRASRIRCSSAADSFRGHDLGTGRRGRHQLSSARCRRSACRQRLRAVVTVVGEQPIDRAIARAVSPAKAAKPSRASRAVRTGIYRHSRVRPSGWALRWMAPLSLRRRPDTIPFHPANPSTKSVGTSSSRVRHPSRSVRSSRHRAGRRERTWSPRWPCTCRR